MDYGRRLSLSTQWPVDTMLANRVHSTCCANLLTTYSDTMSERSYRFAETGDSHSRRAPITTGKCSDLPLTDEDVQRHLVQCEQNRSLGLVPGITSSSSWTHPLRISVLFTCIWSLSEIEYTARLRPCVQEFH